VKTVERRGANHGLHLVLSLLTCGLWAVTGWPVAAVLGRRKVTRSPEPRRIPVPIVSLDGQHYLNPYTNTWERMR
jgi:hypothetical protein